MWFFISYPNRALIGHYYHHHHYHHRVALPSVSIAVSTSWRHFERSLACIHAVLRPRLWGWRSSSIVRSHSRPPRSTCPASPIRWRTIDGCSKDAGVVLWWVGSRMMSEQTKSSLCDNWGDWRLTCSTPHFFVGDMRRIWNMYYTVNTPLIKCIETSTGGHSHTPRVSFVKKNWEYVHVVKSNLDLQTDGRSSVDVTV